MNFKENESVQKLKGSYYTPQWIADFIAKWIGEYSYCDVLEPSCGDGIFFQSFSDNIHFDSKMNVIGFDTDPNAIRGCENRELTSQIYLKVFCEDFLRWSINNLQSDCPMLFDAVVGNPPFIRYQYLDKDMQQSSQELFELMGMKFTKHANAWLPFVLASIRFLKPGGHIGMVIPSEILHVLYAQGIRDYLIENCSKILLVDPEDIWFEDTLQGAMLLMAEKKINFEQRAELGIVRTTGRSFADSEPRMFFEGAEYLPSSFFSKKWTYALLSRKEVDAFNRVKDSKCVYSFNELANVDVGIVTGANKYFLVPDSVVNEYGLSDVAYPMFGRSEHCRGIIYDEEQHKQNALCGYPTNFIYFDTEEAGQNHQDYIEYGEKLGLPNRYKCRIRKPWYKVPSVYASRVSMLKRSNGMPRLILNEAGAYTTDTAYRISANEGVQNEAMVYCFINSLTALSAELEGRFYGGGVLELVPSEIEHLLLIYIDKKWDIQKLNSDIKEKGKDELLEQQDRILLSQVKDINKDDISLLHSALMRLQERRQRIESHSSEDEE